MNGTVQRVAIVTGAGFGIGRAVALRLAADGYDIALFDRDTDAAHGTAAGVAEVGRRSSIFGGDVSVRSDVDAAVARCSDQLGPPDLLVNNAGILKTSRFVDVTYADWRGIFAINLDGAFHFCQAVLPIMMARGAGAIVNVSSWTGKKGVANHAAYGATKAGLINFTQSLAAEFGAHNIRVNAVCPGIIVGTEMRRQAETMNAAQGLPDAEARARDLPLGRTGTADDVAELVAFLASDRAAYMTGQAINVTGGLWMN